MKKEKVQIFIDGGNFYHLVLKKLNIQEDYFPFDEFAHFLANGREITSKRYYVGTVREKEGDERSKERMSRQTRLFAFLKNNHWEIKTSKLRIRNEKIKIDDRVKNYEELKKKGVHEIEIETMREKGIDVKLATDLIVGAIDNKYDTAILVSSDSDLVPALDWIRERKRKKIEYIGFSIVDKKEKNKSTRPLLAMIRCTDIQRVLIESDLKQFIRK
ncbi:MAG: NYN domain-containing protein [Candidatus Pacebacteria bacterium]|nr:NYN domain-containing protein [Candidatus Paceibacterota bacterium]